MRRWCGTGSGTGTPVWDWYHCGELRHQYGTGTSAEMSRHQYCSVTSVGVVEHQFGARAPIWCLDTTMALTAVHAGGWHSTSAGSGA